MGGETVISLTTMTASKTWGRKIRVLVAKPGLVHAQPNGHDRGALLLCRAFRDAGMEVIYAGLFRSPEEVAQIAVDEDVDVIAMSLLNGAHTTAFPKVAKTLRKMKAADILLVGGGIIPDEDKPLLEKQGITGNFGPGTPLKIIVDHVVNRVGLRQARSHRGREKSSRPKRKLT